jgi:hypothetical protein
VTLVHLFAKSNFRARVSSLDFIPLFHQICLLIQSNRINIFMMGKANLICAVFIPSFASPPQRNLPLHMLRGSEMEKEVKKRKTKGEVLEERAKRNKKCVCEIKLNSPRITDCSAEGDARRKSGHCGVVWIPLNNQFLRHKSRRSRKLLLLPWTRK